VRSTGGRQPQTASVSRRSAKVAAVRCHLYTMASGADDAKEGNRPSGLGPRRLSNPDQESAASSEA
jgi:hypothetical protein